MTMNILGVCVLLCVLLGVIVFLVVDVRDKPRRRAEAAAAAEVLVDGQAATVHTITDKAQGKTWRMVYVDRGAIVIPGSERAITVEKP
jgi:hypothetical protein